jgi:hypothetical protein
MNRQWKTSNDIKETFVVEHKSGADIAGLKAAKDFGLETGGWIPKGFKTLDGPRPEYAELYNIKEIDSYSYKVRTWANVKDSDATVRFAKDFKSSGEICTMNGILRHIKTKRRCVDLRH